MAFKSYIDSLSVTNENDISHILIERIKHTVDSYGIIIIFSKTFVSGLREPKIFEHSYVCRRNPLLKKGKNYNLCMEDLAYKAQKHGSVSASSEHLFTSFLELKHVLMKGLSKPKSSKDCSTSVSGKFNTNNKIIMIFQIATKCWLKENDSWVLYYIKCQISQWD